MTSRPLWCLGLILAVVPGVAEAKSHLPLTSDAGIVAADNPVASEAGAEVLGAGGTAADAAVAVATVLGVVHPMSSGMGGGGFCLYFEATTGSVEAYDFRETAPAAATATMYLDAEGNAQPALSVHGGLAVGVPGEVAGLAKLHGDHGVRPWGANFTHAVALARHGAPASPLLVSYLGQDRYSFADTHALAAWMRPNGTVPAAGEMLSNEQLALLLEAIAEHGPRHFYEGSTAEAISSATRAAGGILTTADLAGYQVTMRAPVTGTFRGLDVYSMSPPSSGGIAVIETLNIWEGWDVGELPQGSSRAYHHLSEALKFSFADRAEFLGDPGFVEIPVDELTSKPYADNLRSQILADGVLASDAYGPLRYDKDDAGTSHFSIVDSAGNAASCTTTINTAFGSQVYVEELGLILNNQMDDFVQKPGVANVYGLVGTEANVPAPGKRPLSSMSPTLVLRDGAVALVVGGSGGPRIITSVIQTIINVVDYGMTATASVEEERIHHQWLPPILFLEDSIAEDLWTALEARGQALKWRTMRSAVQLVVVDEGGMRTAASDPRKHGAPAAERRPDAARARGAAD